MPQHYSFGDYLVMSSNEPAETAKWTALVTVALGSFLTLFTVIAIIMGYAYA